MEFKDFIKKILVDLVDSVEEVRQQSHRDMHLSGSKENRTVEFDIAVSVEDSIKGEGSAGIKIFQVIEGGGDIAKKIKNSTVSRIKFGIDIDRWTKSEEAEFESRNSVITTPRSYR